MDRDGFDQACRTLPAVTMVVQWGESQVYKVGGKMFASLGVDDSLSVKCTEIAYRMLTEDETGRRAPYSSGGNWLGLDRLDVIPDDDLRALIAQSHALIAARLTRAVRAELGIG